MRLLYLLTSSNSKQDRKVNENQRPRAFAKLVLICRTMAGHNKWSKVKRYKEVADKKKGAAFSKILKEIMLAAKSGTDPDSNASLRKLIGDAKAISIPKDNIERAIKKGSGELNDGAQLEELVYEGYAPGGIAVLVDCVTDNRLRTQPEIRKIFEKNDGLMAEMGAVAWGFEKKGVILVARSAAKEEALMNLVLEAGADDLSASEEGFEITTSPVAFYTVRDALEKAKIPMELSEVSSIPTNKIPVTGEAAEKIQKLLDILEDHDDVQRVTSNADFT
jgi:YebC/PmpR family DNA-binding regulatory protein